MKPFKIQKILTPVDLSDNSLLALEHGIFMAKLFKADIILAHIVEQSSFSFSNSPQAINPQVESKLKDLADEVKIKSGGKVEVVIKYGKISKKIVEAVKEKNVDLVIMGTHGVSGFEEFFSGSNSFRVVTESPCPVISVQTHSQKIGFHEKLLPIDNSAPSREKVSYAVEIAKHYGAKIHLLGILSVEDNAIVAKFNRMFDQIEDYLKQNDLKFTSELVYGDNIASLTMKYGEKINADLIVIMTEQEENLTGLLLGPFAQQVVNRSKIPVMSITPKINHEGGAVNFMAGGA
jgi:nucleotide-binding universal stress UspA family protein